MGIAETTEETFESDIRGDVPILVDYWAPWCKPCLALTPHIERIASRFEGRVKFMKLNIDEAPSGWERFGVRGIPTLALYFQGKEHARISGPSGIRLEVALGKWLNELGLDAEAEVDRDAVTSTESSVQPENSEVVPRRWSSFNGDADVKAACLAKWRAPNLDPVAHPIEVMGGSRDAFEQVFGAPRLLGNLIVMAYYFRMFRVDDVVQARANLDAQIEAMDIGVDFGGIGEQLLREVVFNSEWSLQGVYREEPVAGLLACIASLHDSEASGAWVDAVAWEGLQREAVDLTERGVSVDVSENVERLASSASTWNVGVVLQILERAAARQRYPVSEWSPQDADLLAERNHAEDAKIKEAIGPLPKEAGPARDNWNAQYTQHHAQIRRANREADPVFWQRYDAWFQHGKENRESFAEDVSKMLFAHIQARSSQEMSGH